MLGQSDEDPATPKFAADLGGLNYDQNKAVAMSGLDPRAAALDERRKREDERIAKTRASQELERQMRSTGQKFHRDEYGQVMPDQDEVTGAPVFHEKDQVDYTPDGRPVRTQVDKTGSFTESDPDQNAPMGGADNDPGTVYKKNKYQPWTPVGNAYDLKGNPNLDPATKDAVLKVAEHGEDAMRKAANEGVSDMEAKTSLDVATSKAQGEDLSKQITDQNTQLDQQNERAGKTEGGSWFFNMGAKPTSDAVAAKTQADKTQASLDALEKQRGEAAQHQITAEAEDKRVKTDGAILKATTQLQGYEAAETKRREMLLKSGKSQEEVDSDPMLSAIAKKRQEVGLDKSVHEQQRMVMQTAGEAATRAFAIDPPSREDLAGIDKSFAEKKGVFDDLQRQYTAEGERLKQGIYTSRDEMQASKDRMEDLSKQMNVAGANANALLNVRNAAVQSFNSPSQATPKQGMRSIDVSVGPDMQLIFKDSRDLSQTTAMPPVSAGSQPGAAPQVESGSLAQKKDDLKNGIMPYQRQIMDERRAIIAKKMEAPEDWGNKSPEEKKTLTEQFQTQKEKELADFDFKKSEAGGEQAKFIEGLQGAKPQSFGEALKDEFTGRIRAAAVAPYAGVQDVSLGLVETLATAESAATGKKFEDTFLGQFAAGARQQTAEAMGDKADSVTAQIMRGAGSSVAFMAAGSSMPAIATVGALSAFGGGYREALEMGATGAKAYARAAVAAGLGATEALPISRMFERLEKVVPGSVKKFLINTGAQFVEEGGQEFAQGALQGVYDKLTGLTKDDWGKIFGEAAEAGTIAGFTGLLFAGTMNAANIRSQRKAAEGYSSEINRAVTSYDQSGGTKARFDELGNQWRSLPTIEPAQGTSRPDQYTADQKTAEAVTGQLPEGSPAVRPEQVAFARQIAPVSSENEIAGMQTELSALDAKVTEAQAKAKAAGVDGGFFVGTDYEAHGKALEELGSAVNARADFLSKIQDKTEEASQRSILSVQAAQEILAMPNVENRSMATGLVKIASGLDQNLLTGSEREMLLKPRKITTPDPITGAPVNQTLPPLIRMEKGQPVITDEAISWMGNNAPISENLISLDETTRLKQIYTKEESQQNANEQPAGTPNGNPATDGLTGEGEQPVGNAPGSDQGETGGIGQGSIPQMGTDGVDQGNSAGGAAPFAPSGDSQSEQRRKLNATRLNPAIPAVITREAKGIASSFQRAGQEVGLDVEEVPKDQAGPSGAFVTFEDDGRIIFKHNPVVMGRNASSSNGEKGKTTEGNASEYLHSMFGEEGLHFGWFSHLRDQWNASPEESKGTFSNFVHKETKTRFEDMRSNLASISKTPSGIELSKAVIGAFNNYYGEESKEPVGDGDNEASGNAVSILDRLSNQTDPTNPENAFNFMNEFARQLAQMRVEGRVTESADANGFFESVMKYLRGALDSLRKVAGNTKTYDAGLDEMVSSMETRYADIQALMRVKPDENAIRTQISTENSQNQPASVTSAPVSQNETSEMVRIKQENNRFKAEQEQRKATQERAKARQGDAKERAAQIDTSTMEGVNQGREAVVTATNNEQIPARYLTLPAGAVQTSHSPVVSDDGSPSALFPKNQNYGGENTRPYDTDITEQSKVNSIAMPGALIPDEIINNSPSAAGGPPQIARVTFLDANGKPKTVFQTAGGNGREMGINLASQEDQGRLSESLRQSAGVFGLKDVPEGHRIYRYLGDYDLRNPEEAKAYQQLVDKLNPSQGKVQGTTQRAKIDANIKIPQETLATLSMDSNPSDSQQIVRKLISDKSLGLDRNLMEATASDPVQSQQYVQQLVITAGLKSDSLNEAYFDLRGDTSSNPARSTMRALIGGTAELGVKLRQKNSSELADSLSSTLERLNAELEKGKPIKQALALIASQQESDFLTKGAGANNAASADVQAIAKALLSNVKTGANGKLSASSTQENFAALLRDINLAVDQQTDESDMFGESRSVSDMIRAAIDNNNRRKGIDGNSVNARQVGDRLPLGEDELKSAISAIHLQALKQSPKFLRDLRTASRASGVEFQSQFANNSVKKLTTALSKIGRKAAVPSDILRGTVVSTERTPEGVAKDARAFVAAMFNVGYKLYAPNGAIDFTDRHLMPEWDYKDIAMKFVRDGDLVVKEVLMLQPKMLIAKHDAHPIYEHIREIDRRLQDKVNPMKQEQVAMIQKVRARKEAHMKQIYKVAYKKDNNQRGDSRYSLDSSMSSEDKYKSGSGAEISPAKSLNSESDKPSGMLEGGTPSSLAAFSTNDFRSSTDRGLSLIRVNNTTAETQSQDQAAARRSRFQDDATSDLFSVESTETMPELTAATNETTLQAEAPINEQPNTRRGETDARRPKAAGAEEPTQNGGMGELFSFMAGQQSAERDFEIAKSEARPPSDAGQQNDSVASLEGSDGRGGSNEAALPLSEQLGGDGGRGDAGRPARKGRTISQAGTGVAIERPEEGSAERNISLNREQRLAPKGVTGKLKANLAAIRIIKALESEGRLATLEEKQELVKFSGWGALSQSFDDEKAGQVERGEIQRLRDQATQYEGYGENAYYTATAERNKKQAQSLENWKNQWGEAHSEIKSLLSDAEYNTAKRSTINAHYTSAEIVAGMWDAVKALGFEGGNVLEPGAGIGHFFGLMPSEVADKSKLFGVELDKYTSKILKALYPEADIQNTGFQTADIADNSIDLAISNVPFANVAVNDPALEAMGGPVSNLHDYFFGKTLTKLKPGGVMAFITSAFTMDKGNPEIRKWLAERADLVAAYRLPNDAFKDNAGTDVVTDVIILRKKDGKPFPYSQSWTGLGDTKTQKGEPIRINEYFANNPSNIFGLLDDDGSMYGDEKEMTVHGDSSNPPSVAMMRQLASLPKAIMGKVEETGPVRTGATGTLKFGNVIKKDGKYFFQGQDTEDEALNAPENAQRVDGFITLRDALNRQYDLELSDTATEAEIEENRTALNAAYDRFVKIRVTKKTKTGKTTNSALGVLTYVHDTFNKSLFAGDPDIFRLLGAELEVERKATSLQNITDIVKGKTKKAFKKADVFSKRVLEPRSEPTKADTIEDAYGISLGWRNRIDTQFIAGLIGKTPEQVEKGLLERGIAFQEPSTGQLYSREQYISGNVRKKLQIAKASGPAYQRNVDLLEGVQPQRVGISDIKFKVGATWIPSEVYTGFLESLGVQGFKFIYKTAAGSSDWAMVKEKRTWKNGVAYKDFETNEVGIEHVMDSLLNFNPIVINYPKKDGGKRNETATQAAREKAKLLTERFVKWVNENEGIANQLTDIYNEEVNAHVQRTYDGQFLSLPWANKDFGIYPDKKNTIWRAIQDGYGLIAHGVGGGKTVIGTAIALEMRRLGMAKKPMIVVHNATLEGFAKEIAKMAPSSRILIGRKDELAGPKRKEFLMRIAAGDWDAVVIAHSTFSTISDDPDVEIAQSKSLIDEALATLKEAGYDSVFDAKADRKKPPTVKALVKLIEKLETSIDKAKDRKKADKDLLNFQQLGVDSLIVDEVHEFKKIPFTTHLTAKGIDGSMSKRAYALFMRARQIQSKTGGKNIFSMTGTPVTNTLGEIWNMIRLVAPNVLKEYKVELFDQFHSKFAEVVTQSEMGPNGEYKNVERLAKFVNLPEWNTFLRQAADIKLGDDMVVKNRPDIKGGAPELIAIKRTTGATEWVRYIREVLKEYEGFTGKQKQENPKLMAVPVQSYMASRAAAIDIRLIDPQAKDEPGSKVNTMIEKLMGIYEQTSEYSGTQAIFADSYRSVKTSIFDEVMGNNLNIEKDPNKIAKITADEEIDESEEEDDDEEEDADPSKTYTDDRFNIYEDIREKLIARGVPADQIAVITDKKYKTDKDKQALFDRVNSGEVRIIMGSTQKLGTGVNMQRLMISAHHLDVPWTPAGLEQRDGRVYRQGNIHGELSIPIELYRYGMEDTLDSSLWQKLVTKQRTSYAALSGKVTGRELEEDDVSLNLSEQQAILGGKTSLRIWEIENRLKELGISKQANGDESNRRLAEIRSAKTYLQVMGNRSDRIAPSLAKMEGVAASVTEKGVNIEVGGETFKTKTETAEAIKAALEESRNRLVLTDKGNQTAPDVTSVSVNGMALRLTPFVTIDKVYDEEAQSMVEKTTINYELISRPEDREDDISFGKVTSPATLLSRLEELGETIEGIKASQRNNLENLRQVAEMSEVAAWPYAEEYDNLVKELEEMRKAYREELGLKEEAKAAEAQPEAAPQEAPMSEGDQLKNKLIAAARKINSFEEEQRTTGNPEYQAALDAAREAREELADYNIGKREGDADYVSAVFARAPRMVAKDSNAPTTELPDGSRIVGPTTFSIAARRAYHGTPHEVDKFSTEKIGTGEGAQVYGWGLYFAENKEVAENYRQALSNPRGYPIVDGKLLDASNLSLTAFRAVKLLAKNDGNPSKAILELKKQYTNLNIPASNPELTEGIAAIREYSGRTESPESAGNTYTVDLMPDDDELLDWDKPIDEQSEQVKEKLKGLLQVSEIKYTSSLTGQPMSVQRTHLKGLPDQGITAGSDLYQLLLENIGIVYGGLTTASYPKEWSSYAKNVSERLLGLGIKGIMYADQGSRSATDFQITPPERTTAGDWMVKDKMKPDSQGGHFNTQEEAESYLKTAQNNQTHNLVIFDDKLVKILEKNGKPVDSVAARSPYFGGLDSRAATAVENAFDSLDSDSMMEQQTKAEDQKPGQRTIGSPRLALGGLNTQIMGVDAYRERIATTETQKQWGEEASAMLKKDYAGTRARLIQAGMLGGSLTPAETKAAMMIVARETTAAATDPTKRAEVAKLVYAYRETGREEARSLSARRDMFMTRPERHREFLAKMIFSPSKADQALIEKMESPAERETAIAAAVERRMSEIEKALKAMGVSFDDILKGEVQISLIGSRVVENTLKAFGDKEQQALRMIQAGQKYENIAKTLGFSVSQVKAMRLKAIASIKNRHFDKVRKGLTVDDLKKDMNAVYARSPRQISEEAAEAEFAKIIEALGFGENAGTGQKAGGKKPFVLEDPIEVIKIARLIAATDKGAMDMVHEYWMASLLSGITTHAANITGNTANAALDLTFQRGMETLVNSMVGDKDSARAGEFKYLMSGLKGSMSAAFRAGIRAYDAEQSMVDYDLLGHELSISPSGFIPGVNTGAAIKGKLGRVIRVPLRALTFMDDFSKTMVARMEVGAQAYRIGKAQGYNGQTLSDFIASEVETIGSQSWERAVGRATNLAFQQKLRSLEEGGNLIEGGAVALNKGLGNYKPGKFFVPFINTIYNIFRTGVRKTPVGSGAMLYKAARQGFYSIQNGKLNPHPYATSEFVRDSAEQVMAWALLAMMWGVVPGDDDDDKKGILITGSQPFQKGMTGLQDLSQRTGVPPYHIRIGDTLFNYGRIEPIATVLGTTADLVKAGKMARDNQEGSEIVGYLASRILGQITDKTYGRGMSDIAGFIQDPKSMANWAATFAATFVPNVLRQPMRAFDPYVRETSIETSPENLPAGVAQRFMQAAVPLPGVNKPRVDLYGNPVKKEGSVVSRLLSPAQAAPAPKVQQADRLFSNWNKNNPSDAYAPARASRRYVDPISGEVKYMDDKTFQKFNERAGKTFAATSRAVITPSMAKNPTEDDKDRVKKLLSQARKEAKREVLMTSPRKERSLKEILFGSI